MENDAPPVYLLGHSNKELDRLSRQARTYEPLTRRLFHEAGMKAGMRVLDVGCGSGDVSFLVASIVGETGEVVGADRAAAAVERARAHAKAAEVANVTFLQGDPTELKFDRPFDAVVGRLVLMYYPDPADAVRKLAEKVRPGGLIVFQEFDFDNCRSFPKAPTFDRTVDWTKKTLAATGASSQMGLELHAVFLAGGLPEPTMLMEALIGGGSEFARYELIADTIQAILPMMEKFKIVAPGEVDIANLARQMQKEVLAGKGVVISPGVIGAWSRKPA
jgi:2-polyprenyl-3-methyl-5-hydroxy-6-metoxy-1,4-benzoquinol methylase